MKFLFVGTDTESLPPDITPLNGAVADQDMKTCPNCQRPFEPGDVVRIYRNDNGERLAHLNCEAPTAVTA